MSQVSCPSPLRPSHAPRPRGPAILSLVLLLATGAAADAAGVSLVRVLEPTSTARLEELSSRGLVVIHAREGLAIGLLDPAVAPALATEVEVLGPAEDGLEHYVLRSDAADHGHPEAALPGSVRVLHRQGDLLVVAMPRSAVEALLGDWTLFRLFHRPAALRLRELPPVNRITADPAIQSVVDSITRSEYEPLHANIVQNDGYQNRYATGAGGTNAQNKIFALFQSYGFTNVVLHTVPGFPTRNVVATLPGSTTPDVHYVVGAHYDTTSNSPGADDNATGTAGVLLMAKKAMEAYQAGVRFENTMIFIAFAAEEWGLYGSAEYAQDATAAGDDIRGMLNMDMIGYVDPGDARDLDTIAKNPSGSYQLQTLAIQAGADYVPGWPVIQSNNSPVAYRSDHASFWDEGIPALFLFEDGYDYCPYIHTSQDTIGRAVNDYDFAVQNLKVVTATFLTLGAPVGSSQAPVAEFTGAPRSGAAPLAVSFADASTGTISSWSWTFGDGGASSVQDPSHTYTTAGSYDVCLTVAGASGSDTECKSAYVTVSGGGGTLPAEVGTGAGPGPANAPSVAVWNAQGAAVGSFAAFGAPGYGADVAAGSFDGDVAGEHVAGPGPNPVYGPHVRGFEALGTPVAKLSFYAFGTLRWGTNVALEDVDQDGIAEVGVGAGPGAVFGPHVRGFDFDGATLGVLPGLSFFAYQTLKYGVNASLGTIDPSPRAEVLTGPGPGPTFGSQVRGFAYSGTGISAIPGVNFFAFASSTHGAVVHHADLDADGMSELLAAPGPAVANPGNVAGFNYDGGTIFQIVDHVATTSLYGARLAGGDLDGDAAHELVTSQGPDPAQQARVRGWNVDAGVVTPLATFDIFPFGTQTYGSRLSVADLGAY